MVYVTMKTKTDKLVPSIVNIQLQFLTIDFLNLDANEKKHQKNAVLNVDFFINQLAYVNFYLL